MKSREHRLKEAGVTIADESDTAGHAPHYLGHRQRLRKRFAENGPKALQDYELMELLLARSIPRRDVKPIAKTLINRFGGFAGALGAPLERLTEINGVGPAVALDLKIVAAAGQELAIGEVKRRQNLSSWKDVIDYCRTTIAFQEREEFHILFLDKRNGLIRNELQSHGTVDHTPVYTREVIKRALELSATALILVHNHPSGDPSPSAADIKMTKELIDVAAPLGIVVHDHIIIGRNGHASLRGLKLI